MVAGFLRNVGIRNLPLQINCQVMVMTRPSTLWSFPCSLFPVHPNPSIVSACQCVDILETASVRT